MYYGSLVVLFVVYTLSGAYQPLLHPHEYFYTVRSFADGGEIKILSHLLFRKKMRCRLNFIARLEPQ
jgi:hypothetical protein